jgi:undecaprenyl-diphosphatase
MKAMNVTAKSLFDRVDAYEQRWCLTLNRGCRSPGLRELFCIVSRLGDGVFWYTLMALMAVIFGYEGLICALRMVIVGLLGAALYKYLKAGLVRERPFISHLGIVQGTRALDRYSFPSGHTLHAVSFTILAVDAFPILAVMLVPFACLVAMSRVVLGLHYPSDVVVGALIGAGLAFGAIALFPLV